MGMGSLVRDMCDGSPRATGAFRGRRRGFRRTRHTAASVTYRGSAAPSRDRRISPIAPRLSGPSRTRPSRSGGSARRPGRAGRPPLSSRNVSRMKTARAAGGGSRTPAHWLRAGPAIARRPRRSRAAHCRKGSAARPGSLAPAPPAPAAHGRLENDQPTGGPETRRGAARPPRLVAADPEAPEGPPRRRRRTGRRAPRRRAVFPPGPAGTTAPWTNGQRPGARAATPPSCRSRHRP